jgi:hypothetical protein
MTRWAFIKSGVVDNIAEGDPSWALSIPAFDAVVDVTDTVPPPARGWTYNGSTFAYAEPVLTVEERAVLAHSQASGVLGILSSTPIDQAALTTNLDYLSHYLGNAQVQALPQLTSKMDSLVATLTTFYGLASPTAVQTAAGLKAQVELGVVVQRITLQVLADLIRYTLAKP